MTAPVGHEIVELTNEQTHPLRLAVLRHDTPTKVVEFPEDTWPGALHLGIRIGDELVATSSWIPRPFPDPEPHGWSELVAWQLRGMATARHLQGRGFGALLLQAGCERARSAGAAVVWANARDRVMPFYTGFGFTCLGDGWIDDATQLPHHRVARPL
jgi:GNAT superfamily N-acetyltransferase